MTAKQELESFTQFALARVVGGGKQPTLDELFDSWRAENPSEEMAATDREAVREAWQEFQAGDRGLPAGELSAQLRNRAQRASS